MRLSVSSLLSVAVGLPVSLWAQQVRVVEVIPTSEPLPLREVARTENSRSTVLKPRTLGTKRQVGTQEPSSREHQNQAPVLVAEQPEPSIGARTKRLAEESWVVPTLPLPEEPETGRGERSSWLDTIEQVDGQSPMPDPAAEARWRELSQAEMEPIYDANAPLHEQGQEEGSKGGLALTDPTPELQEEEEAEDPVLVRFALRDIALLQQAARQAGGELEVVIRPKGVTPQQLVAPLLRTGAFQLRKDADGLVVVSCPVDTGNGTGPGKDTPERKLALIRARNHLLSQLAEVEDALK